MSGGFFRGLVIAILLIAVVGGAALYAYNAGVAQGLADSGKLVAPATGVAPYPYYAPYFFRPFGFGFGFLGCLFPLLFLLLFFGLLRGIFWHGRWGGHHHGHWDNGVPPRFEEWHKRAHEPKPSSEG